MADLIAIAYENEARAERVRARVPDLRKACLTAPEDAVGVEGDADGKARCPRLFTAAAG